MSDSGASTGPRWQAQYGIGVALLMIAAALWLDAARLPLSPAVGVGPSAGMRLVGALVGLLGLAHFVAAWRARRQGLAQKADHGNKSSLALVMIALVGQIVLLELGAGFVLSSLWLFTLTARGFGEPFRLRSLGIGLALSLGIYLFFTNVLSLALPVGPIERLLT